MDIVCFSHLRWDFVFQRPQHLLTRLSKKYRIFYIEEPVFDATHTHNHVSMRNERVTVVVPHLAAHERAERISLQKTLLSQLWHDYSIRDFCFWYYTPMALPFTRHMNPKVVVYDCMDELANFKFCPPELTSLENELFDRADVVFTGGHSLYRAKKDRHANVHAFPSSIDKAHFMKARKAGEDPADQASIPYPRIGFFGVLDERFDADLIDQVAAQRPDWHFVLIGPVVKIDPATLPKRTNIHYLGGKSYTELPEYIRGWQVAMIPFALNESTKFISPTKTPEYLAAGKPVISTAIDDVVSPYGEEGLVHICHNPADFINQAQTELSNDDPASWLGRADEFLQDQSWDKTCAAMDEILQDAVKSFSNSKPLQYV
jgi:UDP-galactopyranose mutase